MFYTTWRKMSETEKLKLAMAHCAGETIEYRSGEIGGWTRLIRPAFDDDDAYYRVKPEWQGIAHEAEDVIATISSGHFYEDYDASSEGVGILRDLLEERNDLRKRQQYIEYMLSTDEQMIGDELRLVEIITKAFNYGRDGGEDKECVTVNPIKDILEKYKSIVD